MRSFTIVRFQLFVISCALVGATVQQVHAQSNTTIKVKEEKSIVFTIVGMKTMEDARRTEVLLLNLPGVIRARTSYASFMSSCITSQGSNIDQQTITDLFEPEGFSIVDYAEHMIQHPLVPVEHKTVQGQGLQSPGDPDPIEKNKYKMATSHVKEKIRQYEVMREDAIKRGVPTKKYDDKINWLKSQL
ncbi:MAG TPA: hypothetical protein EYN71_00380 [Flavobacteriales bacterium]|jgi:hypothetical protein|nr:hypothetical protein [Flavobacteriales bacterium]